MKIGILSINAHTWVLNFASPLHSYAFQQFLEKNGIDSTIIDYKPYSGDFDSRHPLFYYIDHPRGDEKKQRKILAKWKDVFYERIERFEKFEQFIEKYYKKTDKCYNVDTIEDEDPGFDCYICATDVIWKYNRGTGFDRAFFLAAKPFEGKKKIAYAASRGASEYTKEQAAAFFDYISDMDFISVREKSLENYIKENSDLPVRRVLDPVFLHEKEFYSDLAVTPDISAGTGYVLIYLCMDRSTDVVKNAVAFAKAHNLQVIELSEWKKDADLVKGHRHRVLYNVGIEEWLGYMQCAEYIFTNSFHACCFSILFHKQFFAGKRSGDKIESLLEMFHLSGRRITEFNPEYFQHIEAIDYEQVDKLRYEYVKQSSDFILNAIHRLENEEHQSHKDLVHKSVYEKETPPAAKAEAPAEKQEQKAASPSKLKSIFKHLRH